MRDSLNDRSGVIPLGHQSAEKIDNWRTHFVTSGSIALHLSR